MNAGWAEDERPTGLLAEPAVALTDAVLGIEAATFAALLARDSRYRGSPLRTPVLAFFGATAGASIAGAALHAITTERSDPRRQILWRFSLTSIGMAAVSSWWLGARLSLSSTVATGVARGATLAHVPYFATVVGTDRPFRIAIACYLPGALFLGGALASRLGDPFDRGPAALGLGALGLTFAAAGVQVGRIGLGRRYDHNALYHSLQAIGVAMFFRGAGGLLANPVRQNSRSR